MNYLPAGAENLAQAFGWTDPIEGRGALQSDDWTSLETGAPIFKSAVAAIDCILETTFRYSSTTIVVGWVVGLRTGEGQPMMFHQGQHLSV